MSDDTIETPAPVEAPRNTAENGSGSAMCPAGHPWYASWTTDDAGVVSVTPATCPEQGAGHDQGCGLGWVARMVHGENLPPGDWVERDPVEAAAVVAERDRRIAEGSKEIGVAGALNAGKGPQ